jgi:predicted molibdopterin-dependent oxidoreductase YjgC
VRYNEVEWLAKLIARSRTMVSVWSMGLTQHRFGTQNVMAVANLHLARGAIGREKCGLMPIRGHSGVQGGGECGVTPEKYPGGFAVNPENAERFSQLWGHPVPYSPGLSTAEMVEAAHAGGIDLLYNIGGNLFATMPDPDRVGEAFSRIRVRIHQDINVNTSTLLDPTDDGFVLLLPAQTRYEQRGGGTSTSTERRIRFSPEIEGHPIIGEARPEYEIPAQVAMAARPELADALTWADSGDIRREMGRVMPVYAGIENLNREGDQVQWGGPMLCAGGSFPNLPDGRARFAPIEPPNPEWGAGRYVLTNRRGKQFNSMVFSEVDAIAGGKRRDEVVISEADAEREGVRSGDRVRVKNARGSLDLVVRIDAIKDGHLQVYWPECNRLLPNTWDPVSKEPDYNTRVDLERVGA